MTGNLNSPTALRGINIEAGNYPRISPYLGISFV
jgi:hypothetical protein